MKNVETQTNNHVINSIDKVLQFQHISKQQGTPATWKLFFFLYFKKKKNFFIKFECLKLWIE